MPDTWTGGVVASMNGESPPTVPAWQDVSVPGAPTVFADEMGPIAYKRMFPDPRSDEHERAELELNGVYGHAHVWINDRYLGDHEGPIEPARFPFDPESTNELVIACEPSPSTAALAAQEGLPDAAAVPGIRDGVSVHRRTDTRLGEMQVTPDVGDGHASLSVTVTVDTIEPVDDVITFSLRPNGFRGGGSMDRTPIEVGGDEHVDVETTIDVRDPALWWPRGLGSQHRYTLRAKLGDRSIERTIGLRTVDRDEGGLRVNGTHVPARGVTIPPGAATQSAIDAAVQANATLVRFPGHVPPREVYEICDEAGLLVWQDLPIPTGVDVDHATNVGDRLYRHRYSNPCLAAIGVQDAGHAPFDDSLGAGFLSKLRVRWRAWRTSLDRSSAEAVAANLDDGLVPIPLVGSPGTGADVVRFAPGWRYLDADSVNWLLDQFLDDTALGGVIGSPVERLAENASPIPGRTSDDVPSDTHERTTDPVTTDGGSRAISSDQYPSALKTGIEGLRRRRAGLTLVETRQDAGTGDALDTRSDDETTQPAFHAVRDSFEPIQAVVEGHPSAGASATIWLLNETPDPIEASVSCREADVTEPMAAAVEAFGVADVGTLSVPANATALTLIVDVAGRTIENEYRL